MTTIRKCVVAALATGLLVFGAGAALAADEPNGNNNNNVDDGQVLDVDDGEVGQSGLTGTN